MKSGSYRLVAENCVFGDQGSQSLAHFFQSELPRGDRGKVERVGLRLSSRRNAHGISQCLEGPDDVIRRGTKVCNETTSRFGGAGFSGIGEESNRPIRAYQSYGRGAYQLFNFGATG